MCTAVVGGSTHRAARRISAERNQRSTTPMTSHRIKDRRKPVRSGGWVGVSGIGLSAMAVTFQNNSLSGLPLMDVRTDKMFFRGPAFGAPTLRTNAALMSSAVQE